MAGSSFALRPPCLFLHLLLTLGQLDIEHT
jgi:hypothetical protein